MKWELHAHTTEGSLCGRVPAPEVVYRHHEAGFSGIVITDHFNRENLRGRPGTPLDQIRSWLSGYTEALKAGRRLGLTVLFGAEIQLSACGNDYLIYGAEPDFLLENPALIDLDLSALYALVQRYHAVIIQAHPNRLGCCHPADSAYVDGYEVFNGNPRHQNRNELSVPLVGKDPLLIGISGSDYHQIEDLDTGSVEIVGNIHTSAQLAGCLRRKSFALMHGPAEMYAAIERQGASKPVAVWQLSEGIES